MAAESRTDGVEVKNGTFNKADRLTQILTMRPQLDPSTVGRVLRLEDEFSLEKYTMTADSELPIINTQDFRSWMLDRGIVVDLQVIEDIFDSETLFYNELGLVVPPLSPEDIATLSRPASFPEKSASSVDNTEEDAV